MLFRSTTVAPAVNPYIGDLNAPSPTGAATPTSNNIIRILTDLGQPLSAFNQGYSRDLSVTPGRSFAGKTKDYGFSGQIDYDFGGATLTSIRSEEHTSELQSLMRISYAVFCLKKKTTLKNPEHRSQNSTLNKTYTTIHRT